MIASVPSVKGSGPLSVDQREARVAFVDCPGYEVDRLKEPVGARGFEAVAGELAGDILGGFAVAHAAGVATFELVIGQNRDVRPPALAVGHVTGPEHAGEANAVRDRRQRVPKLCRASWVFLDEF